MKTPSRRTSLIATLTTIALAILALPAWQAAAAESDVAVDTWVWNIAGGYHDFDEQVAAVTSSIEERDPDFVVVNELCDVQYDSLKKELVEIGWTDASNFARFSEMDDRSKCEAGDQSAVGIGLFSKHQLNKGADETKLEQDPHSAGRSHFLTCVTAERAPDLRMCGTHIVPNTGLDGEPTDAGIAQIQDVEATTSAYMDNGEAVVMAGDFNAKPNWGRLDRLYSKNVEGDVNGDNYGAFRELDDNDADNCLGYGEGTMAEGDRPEGCDNDQGPKIDMIFASEAHIGGDYDAEVMPQPNSCEECSDHFGVYGNATFGL